MTGTLLFVVVPYVCLAIFIGGHVWRYRYDKFGWTTRSSQLYERRLLRIGSPLFHFGILLVALGHIGGLLIPESWTAAAGVSETAYHAAAAGLGTVAGFCTLVGVAIFVYRRRTVGPVFSATTLNDKGVVAADRLRGFIGPGRRRAVDEAWTRTAERTRAAGSPGPSAPFRCR